MVKMQVNFKTINKITKRYPLWEVLVFDLGLKIKCVEDCSRKIKCFFNYLSPHFSCFSYPT